MHIVTINADVVVISIIVAIIIPVTTLVTIIVIITILSTIIKSIIIVIINITKTLNYQTYTVGKGNTGAMGVVKFPRWNVRWNLKGRR